MNSVQTRSWDVRVEGDTVVVELTKGLTLDEDASEEINERFGPAIRRPHVENVLTLLHVDHSISAELLAEVKEGADLAVDNGITHWAIVADETIKGLAFNSSLEGLETKVFKSEAEARSWME